MTILVFPEISFWKKILWWKLLTVEFPNTWKQSALLSTATPAPFKETLESAQSKSKFEIWNAIICFLSCVVTTQCKLRCHMCASQSVPKRLELESSAKACRVRAAQLTEKHFFEMNNHWWWLCSDQVKSPSVKASTAPIDEMSFPNGTHTQAPPPARLGTLCMLR